MKLKYTYQIKIPTSVRLPKFFGNLEKRSLLVSILEWVVSIFEWIMSINNWLLLPRACCFKILKILICQRKLQKNLNFVASKNAERKLYCWRLAFCRFFFFDNSVQQLGFKSKNFPVDVAAEANTKFHSLTLQIKIRLPWHAKAYKSVSNQ